MTWLTSVTATILAQSIVMILPDIRSAYSAIPVLCMIFFMFSGIIFKPECLPRWLAPWLPSISAIRWIAQGMTLNEFGTNDDVFATIPLFGGYSTWEAYLNLFGWGGKSKYLCTYYLLINMAIFRVVQLLGACYVTISQKGRRGLRKNITQDRMY
jgi:hypothetical protein